MTSKKHSSPKSPLRTKDGRGIYRTYYRGAILRLFEKVIKPLLSKLSPDENETSLNEGIKRFFHYETRSIYFARATRNFTIPGKEWMELHPRRLGWSGSPRRVLKDMTMVIRIDETMPDRVEIEFGDAVFVLDQFMWKTVKEWVDLVA